ncbi:MAG: hypothetical protein ACF8OB_15685 [Phycisphaeraceae bacterium JB051]
MCETETQAVEVEKKFGRVVGHIWLAFLVLVILFFDGWFLWGVREISQRYTGELTITRGHELCEMYMIQAVLTLFIWIAAGAALLLAITLLLRRKTLRWRTLRLCLLLILFAVGLWWGVGTKPWLTDSINGLIVEQGHMLSHGQKTGNDLARR